GEERATLWPRRCRRAPPDRSPQPPWLPGQPPRVPGMERNLAMELVRVTEAAALASARLMGRGDEMAADVAAIEAMRTAFDAIAIDGTVVIGEGAEDAMPKLYVGERVGTRQGPATDVALDALEGAAICAAGGYNALIEEVRRAGARIKLITSGDVSAALATTRPDTGIDILMGVGG